MRGDDGFINFRLMDELTGMYRPQGDEGPRLVTRSAIGVLLGRRSTILRRGSTIGVLRSRGTVGVLLGRRSAILRLGIAVLGRVSGSAIHVRNLVGLLRGSTVGVLRRRGAILRSTIGARGSAVRVGSSHTRRRGTIRVVGGGSGGGLLNSLNGNRSRRRG